MNGKEAEKNEGRRRAHSGAEIMTVLKRHLVEKKPLSEVCKEFDICPSQFYRWQAIWLERGAEMFERKNPATRRDRLDSMQRIATLEEKIQKKDSVMAELLEEHVALKKSLGEA